MKFALISAKAVRWEFSEILRRRKVGCSNNWIGELLYLTKDEASTYQTVMSAVTMREALTSWA
jgi:hypothetical protein